MKAFIDLIRREPVKFAAVCRQALTMLMGFGLGLTGEQLALVMLFVETMTAFITSAQVTSNPEVARQVGKALNTPVPTATSVSEIMEGEKK